MNANELADALQETEPYYSTDYKLFDNAATMLRQQQAEIDALKQIIDANNLNQNIGQFVKPTNEPVAWISVLGIDLIGQKFTDVRVSLTKTDVASIPLYTHPVKELALTDEEMISIYEKDWSGIKCGLGRAVEQAILRKAQEK
jgi:hypothetical protein